MSFRKPKIWREILGPTHNQTSQSRKTNFLEDGNTAFEAEF